MVYNDTNHFRYCGEYYDNLTDYIYLRGRYYDPEIGRFLTEDPAFDGVNWYSYCNGNPVMFFDHNGFESSYKASEYANIPCIDSNGNRVQGPEQSSKYTQAFIDYIKSYETHTVENGIHKLSNNGATIGYGHDLTQAEIESGIYKDGINEDQATKLLIQDLDKKYNLIDTKINELNDEYGYSIDINSFSKDEMYFLLDFSYNRGAGLVVRSDLKAANKPNQSLTMLIIATSQKNDTQIASILKSETRNLNGAYYEGLELRRLDEYDIYKHGDYTRNYDVTRRYK